MNPEVAARLMHKMIQPLRHYPWYRWAKQSSAGAALGLVSLGTLAPMPRCLRSEDGRYLLAFEGEIYNTDELQEVLGPDDFEGDASEAQNAVVLRAMMRWGATALDRFNGLFQLAFWDALEQKLIVGCDPAGLRPIYVAHKKEQFAFAPEVKALLNLPWLSREVDIYGLLGFLRNGFPTGNHTFFQEVKILPAGSFAVFRRGKLQIQRYWTTHFREESHLDDREIQRRFLETWQGVMRRQSQGELRFGALLDGELESRMILAALVASGKRLPTFTIGNPSCQEALHARQLAQAVRCPNLFSPVLPGEAVHGMEKAVYLTDGMCNCFDVNIRYLLPSLAETVDLVFDSIAPVALFGFEESQSRFLAAAAHPLRSVVEVRCPFFDKSMLQQFVEMAPRCCGEEKPLHQHAIRELSPELAGIPWQRTGLPLAAGSVQSHLHRSAGFVRRKANEFLSRCLGRTAKRSCANGSIDYNEMIRASSELQNLLASHLADSWAEGSGLFNRQSLRSLLNNHLSGKGNHAEMIGRVLTVELWHKQFVRDASHVERHIDTPVRELALREAA
jgi:hypothetical protein